MEFYILDNSIKNQGVCDTHDFLWKLEGKEELEDYEILLEFHGGLVVWWFGGRSGASGGLDVWWFGGRSGASGGLVVWMFGGLDCSIKKSWASPHDFLWKFDRKEELEVVY